MFTSTSIATSINFPQGDSSIPGGSPGNKPKSNIGAIAGGVVGGAVFLGVVLLGLFFYLRRRRDLQAQHQREMAAAVPVRSMRHNPASSFDLMASHRYEEESVPEVIERRLDAKGRPQELVLSTVGYSTTPSQPSSSPGQSSREMLANPEFLQEENENLRLALQHLRQEISRAPPAPPSYSDAGLN